MEHFLDLNLLLRPYYLRLKNSV